MPIPKYPVLFVSQHVHHRPSPRQLITFLQYKPITSVTGPTDPIPVHPLAQEGQGLDWECELVAVILDYVLGYAVGNDVSHRDWQLQRGGGQWALGKGFDGWAPFSPRIVSNNVIKDPQNLAISTKVNGKTMQESNTAD